METLEGARELVNTERVRAVRELAVEGEPADAILATAAEQRADLIVIGNRGMGALSGHLLGSVPGDIATAPPATSSSSRPSRSPATTSSPPEQTARGFQVMILSPSCPQQDQDQRMARAARSRSARCRAARCTAMTGRGAGRSRVR